MKKIRISVLWPDDWKSVVLEQREYKKILAGKPFEKEGEGYSYEGKNFQDYWYFNGGCDSDVVVTYDDGGTGFEGTLDECEIEEF
jgi:hypothetical protein